MSDPETPEGPKPEQIPPPAAPPKREGLLGRTITRLKSVENPLRHLGGKPAESGFLGTRKTRREFLTQAAAAGVATGLAVEGGIQLGQSLDFMAKLGSAFDTGDTAAVGETMTTPPEPTVEATRTPQYEPFQPTGPIETVTDSGLPVSPIRLRFTQVVNDESRPLQMGVPHEKALDFTSAENKLAERDKGMDTLRIFLEGNFNQSFLDNFYATLRKDNVYMEMQLKPSGGNPDRMDGYIFQIYEEGADGKKREIANMMVAKNPDQSHEIQGSAIAEFRLNKAGELITLYEAGDDLHVGHGEMITLMNDNVLKRPIAIDKWESAQNSGIHKAVATPLMGDTQERLDMYSMGAGRTVKIWEATRKKLRAIA